MVIVGILDDQVKQIEYLRGVVGDFFRGREIECQIHTSTNSAEFTQHANDYMIVFLDVEMGDENGIDVGKKIREANVKTLVIYVTGHEEYRIAADDVRFFSYLQKPITKEKIIKLLNDGLRYVEEKHKMRRFETDGAPALLKISDILYFEGQERTAIVHTADKSYKINYTLHQIEDSLDSNFIYSHRSYLLNRKHILEFDNTEVTMTNSAIIPVAKRRLTKFKEDLMQSFWG